MTSFILLVLAVVVAAGILLHLYAPVLFAIGLATLALLVYGGLIVAGLVLFALVGRSLLQNLIDRHR